MFSIGQSPNSFMYPLKQYFKVEPGKTYRLYNQEFNLGSGTSAYKDVFFVGDSWLATSDGNLWGKILVGTGLAVIYRTGPNVSPLQSGIYCFKLNLGVYFVD